mmetsp:Transcript_12901/g.38841  ORF Transcript_12901/g.38841 Transcript_12901/m.38841 type:complete len:221 (+) Transcript_12901:599-1261(+)
MGRRGALPDSVPHGTGGMTLCNPTVTAALETEETLRGEAALLSEPLADNATAALLHSEVSIADYMFAGLTQHIQFLLKVRLREHDEASRQAHGSRYGAALVDLVLLAHIQKDARRLREPLGNHGGLDKLSWGALLCMVVGRAAKRGHLFTWMRPAPARVSTLWGCPAWPTGMPGLGHSQNRGRVASRVPQPPEGTCPGAMQRPRPWTASRAPQQAGNERT